MAHCTYTVTHHDAHGGIENHLPALFTALPSSLAALILDTFGHRTRYSGSPFSCNCHDSFLFENVLKNA
ncbi:hypothetical protein AN901_200559 [Pseudomonas syringae pv. theae]|nr:hypothetical protein AN901_200559 [Pseudomonas syringae pv. theae]